MIITAWPMLAFLAPNMQTTRHKPIVSTALLFLLSFCSLMLSSTVSSTSRKGLLFETFIVVN